MGGDSTGYAVSTHRSGQSASSPVPERDKVEGRSKARWIGCTDGLGWMKDKDGIKRGS